MVSRRLPDVKIILLLVLILSISVNVYLYGSVQQERRLVSSKSATTATVSNIATRTYQNVSTTTLTSTVNQFSTSSESTNRSAGMELVLTTNTSTIVDSLPNSTALNVTVSDYNVLPENSVSTSGNYSINSLGAMVPCIWLPFGIGVYKGYYSSDNISAGKSVESLYSYFNAACPNSGPQPRYYFFPSSNSSIPIRSSIPLSGYCCRSPTYNVSYNPDYYFLLSEIPFSTGVYTLAAGDIWGNLVMLHFEVVASTPPNAVGPQNLTHHISVEKTTGYPPPCDSNCGADYTFEVNASYNGTQKWLLNPMNFILVTNSDINRIDYQISPPFFGLINLSSPVVLSENTRVNVSVSFWIPQGQIPLGLDYNVSSQSLYLAADNLPPVSTWVSSLYLERGASVATFLDSANKSVTGLLAEATVFNSTQSGFYSGSRILVSLYLINLNQSSIVIDSITASGGFQVSSISPPLPSRVGYAPLQLEVVLLAPSDSSYYGQLVFTIIVG